jgi:hypothetical protein
MICDHCGVEFDRSGTRGPIPRFCSDSCRAMAHQLQIRVERAALEEEVERLLKGLAYATDRIKALTAERDESIAEVRKMAMEAITTFGFYQRAAEERDALRALVNDLLDYSGSEGYPADLQSRIEAFLAKHEP